MHIVIISGTTVTCFFSFKQETRSVRFYRTVLSFLVFTALQDIFLAFNMFFILEEGQTPDIIRDEGR